MSGSDPVMMTPAFKWEWNVNTIVVLLGFFGSFVVGGYIINDMVRNTVDVSRGLERANTRMDRIELEIRSLPNHELRLTAAERALAEAVQTTRDVEKSVNELKTDTRVIREIVERIDVTQQRTYNRTRMPTFKRSLFADQ
jgi:hypothetical protein